MEKHQFTFQHPYGMSEPQTDHEEEHKEPAPKPRGARACMSCRRVKMKCVGGDDSIGKKCDRCERNGSDCVFEQHRRGRKPGAGLSESSKMLRRLEKGLPNAKSQLPQPDTSPQVSGAVLGKRSREELKGTDGDKEYNDEEGTDTQRKASYFKTILNPTEEGSCQLPGPSALLRLAPPTELPDPISAGLLDEATAETVLAQLFARLNPFIALFDPVLHTLPFLRARSPFLLSALLAAGCKFFRPGAHAAAAELAHAHAVRAFADGAAGVEVAQAFVALTYWHEPADGRAWAYIGYACRMAVELGLNRPPAPPPHRETEREARERRNRGRTYLVLFVLDRSLSIQTGRQWMLPEGEFVRRAGAWLDETLLPVTREDVIVAACVELRRISGDTADALMMDQDARGGRVDCDILLRDSNERLNHWAKHWRGRMSLAGGEPFQFAFLRFFQLHVRLFLNSFGVQTALRSSSPARPNMQALDACYSSALETLEIVSKDFAQMRVLPYAQDNVTVMMTYSAIFLLELLRSPNTSRELEEGAAGKVHALIAETAQAYGDAAEFMPTSASAAHQAQFLRRLLLEHGQRDDTLRAEQRKRQCEEFNVPAHNSTTPYPQEYGAYRWQERDEVDGREMRSPYPVRAPPPETSAYRLPARRSVSPYRRSVERSASSLPCTPGPSSYYARCCTPKYAAYPRDMYEHTALPPPCPRRCPSDYAPRDTRAASPRPPRLPAPQYPTPSPDPPVPARRPTPEATERDVRYWRSMFRELGFGEGEDVEGPYCVRGRAREGREVGRVGSRGSSR
ncbi:fungal-specific transcription factor domain-containing protein [Sparassis latifolia]